MDKETLRMQMLAGIITEGQLKENENEGYFDSIDADMSPSFKEEFVNLIEVISEDLYENAGYEQNFIQEYLKYLIDKN